MRIKLGDLREESKELTKQIKTMTSRRDAIESLISVYVGGKAAVKSALAEIAPAFVPPAAPLRPLPPPGIAKKAERRPTGKTILGIFDGAEPNASMTQGQICSAIGYERSGRDLALVRASLCSLVKSGTLKINPLGLYVRGDK
jgi:hypothetical protein